MKKSSGSGFNIRELVKPSSNPRAGASAGPKPAAAASNPKPKKKKAASTDDTMPSKEMSQPSPAPMGAYMGQ